MSALFLIGLGIYMIGHGLRGLPLDGAVLASVALMVTGGVLVLLTAVI